MKFPKPSGSVASSIDLRCIGLAVNDTFKFTFKNFSIKQINIDGVIRTRLAAVEMTTGVGLKRYTDPNLDKDFLDVDVADVNQAATGTAGKAITAGILRTMARGNSLYKFDGTIQNSDRTIEPKRATVTDLLTGTTNRDAIVTNSVLNAAINLGRAVDVTSDALHKGMEPSGTYDIRGTYTITAANVASNTKVKYGFVNSPDTPFPKFAPGLKYLFIAEVKNLSTVTLAGVQFDETNQPIGDIPMALTDVSASEESYTRIACTTTTPYNSLTAWQTSGSAKTISLGIKNWRQYEVTALSDEAIDALAHMSDLDDAFAKFFVKQDAVCPWLSIINMETSPAVTIGAGLSYKLFALSGTHTLSVDSVVPGAYGRDAHISLYVGDTGNVVVQAPLILMDPLTPNAINNCIVKFRNGDARMYVSDHDGGYAVSVATGTVDGSLYTGLTRTIESGQVEYITFSHLLDGETILLSITAGGTILPINKQVSMIGNSTSNTVLDLNEGYLTLNENMSVYAVTLNNGTFTLAANKSLTINNSVINININTTNSGAAVEFNGNCTINGIVSGSNVTMGAGATITGTGTFNLNSTGRLALSNVTVNGLTFTNGRSADVGGAISDSTNGNRTTVSNGTFNTCSATRYGGAISLRRGDGAITNCVISGCTAYYDGGAIELASNTAIAGATHTVSGVTITNCKAANGGGIVVNSARASVTDTSITGCTTEGLGGGIGVTYGGECTIVSNTIEKNSAETLGGGIGIHGGDCKGFISSCGIASNTAYIGGGIAVTIGSATVSSCTINNNRADTSGGAMYVANTAKVTVKDCNITGNTCESWPVLVTGAGASLTMTNCTIANNSATARGAIAPGASASLTMINCVVSGNKANVCGGIQIGGSVTAVLESCTIYGNSGVVSAGGIFSEAAGGVVTMTSCVVAENSAPGAGVGLRTTNNAKFIMEDCKFESGQDIYFGGTGLLVLGGTCTFKAPVNAAPAAIYIQSNATIDITSANAATPISGATIAVGNYNGTTFTQGGSAYIKSWEPFTRVVAGSGTSFGSGGNNNLTDVKRIASAINVQNFDMTYSAGVPVEFVSGANFIWFANGATNAGIQGSPIHISSGAGLYTKGAQQTTDPDHGQDFNTNGEFNGYEIHGTKINYLGYIEGATVTAHPGDDIGYYYRQGTSSAYAVIANSGTVNSSVVLPTDALLMSVSDT